MTMQNGTSAAGDPEPSRAPRRTPPPVLHLFPALASGLSRAPGQSMTM